MNLDDFFGPDNLHKAFELTEYMNARGLFDVKNTGIPYKTINHWDRHDLLVSRRKETSKWRKFSFVDFIWLKIIEQFRTVGTPIPILQKVRSEIFQEVKTKDLSWVVKQAKKKTGEVVSSIYGHEKHLESPSKPVDGKNTFGVSLLQLLICESIFDRIPVSLLVFTDGHWFPWYEDRPKIYSAEDLHRMVYQTHVKVSITEAIKGFLISENSVFALPELHLLTDVEVKLLEIIHAGEYDSITIHFKEKGAKSIEMVKAQDVKRKLVDILAESDYQEVVIKSHQGMVTTIKNTIKIKL